jgi:hypothetical protein
VCFFFQAPRKQTSKTSKTLLFAQSMKTTKHYTHRRSFDFDFLKDLLVSGKDDDFRRFLARKS